MIFAWRSARCAYAKVMETSGEIRNDPSRYQTELLTWARERAHLDLDSLLTWNCRHIANAAIVEKLRAVCIREGYAAPVICTPHELML